MSKPEMKDMKDMKSMKGKRPPMKKGVLGRLLKMLFADWEKLPLFSKALLSPRQRRLI